MSAAESVFPENFRLLRVIPAAEASSMLQTLVLILRNALEKGGPEPDREKYLKLNASNAALKTKVLAVTGGENLLRAAGFSKVSEEDAVFFKVRHCVVLGLVTFTDGILCTCS